MEYLSRIIFTSPLLCNFLYAASKAWIVGHPPARVAQDEGVAQLQAEKMRGIHSGIHASQNDGRVSGQNGEIAMVKGAGKSLIAVV